MSNPVWLVGYELKSNTLDDNGIEGVFASREIATEYIAKYSKKYPKYRFEILGEYYVIESVKDD